MKNKKILFTNYLKERNLYSSEIEGLFDVYFKELSETNQHINLFSRKMDTEDIWLMHFLDSVSIMDVFSDWNNKKVLDFGTGGGLPGIPINIINPLCEMTFLDSVKKKISAIKKMTDILKLDKAKFIDLRIEDKDLKNYSGYFDIIVCRSVKMNQVIKKSMESLLTKKGRIFLYKAKSFEDVEIFKKYEIHQLELNIGCERRIIEIKYG